MVSSIVKTSVLDGFDDPRCSREVWNELASKGSSDVVFLTPEWQRTWWETFAPGKLMLLAAEREGRTVAIAPFFETGRMVFFVGSGGSDYLDLVGDVDSEVLEGFLETARANVPEFVGFRFHHVRRSSGTPALLERAAENLGLTIFNEGTLPSPALRMGDDGEAAREATRKKSLVRHERYFEREGTLEVRHMSQAEEILPHLDEFFDQHVERWAVTDHPSLFNDPNQRMFYERLVRTGAPWLRFTRIDWNGSPIAFHFGSSYRGRYFWYKPTFALELSKRSPGEVLLRNLLFAAIAEGCEVFDLGLGDEGFKERFASEVEHVDTWGLYPPEVVSAAGEDS